MALPTERTATLAWYDRIEIAALAEGGNRWWHAERWLAQNDLFYLLTRVLRRIDVNRDWLFDRCREVQAEPNGCLDLWSRGHYKSTLITFGLTMLDIINNPELTIAVLSHTRPIAKGFLVQLKREMEENPILKALFPDIFWEVPHRDSPRWGEDAGIVVRRKSNPKESTVEGWGLIDGQPTSRHFDILIYDDVVTRENVTTGEQVRKTTEALELSMNLAAKDGKMRFIGTRYCLPGGARILLGDWTHKPICDVQVGDTVVGWELRDGKRWMTRTRVLHAGMHSDQPINRYTFDNGRSVTCTPDHKWWRGAQWAASGKDEDGDQSGREYSALGMAYHDYKHIRQLIIPTEISTSRDAAWLAGFFDGDGTVKKNQFHPSGIIALTQSEKNMPLIVHAKKVLTSLGFEWTSNINHSPLSDNPFHHIYVNGGLKERYRFLAEVAPIRRDKLIDTLFGQLMTDRLRLVSIEDAGTADVHWIETETGNYVAEGFCSKNSLFDTYADLLDRNAAKPRIYPATHNGKFDGRPVLFSADEWRGKLRDMSRTTIAAQLLQNPMADSSATFRTEWLKSYEVRPRTLNVYVLADPSRGRSATSDNTAIAVVGIAAGGAKFLLDGACHRMTLSQRWTMLRNLRRKWSAARGVQHIEVGYERYGAQSDDEYFTEQMDLDAKRGIRDSHFTIAELNWPREGGNSKKERVERLEPDFRNGRFYLPLPVWRNGSPQMWRIDTDVDSKSFGEIGYRELGLTRAQMAAVEGGSADLVAKAIRCVDQDGRMYDLTLRFMDEYGTFPFGRNDDLVDACSRVYDMEPRGPAVTRPEMLEPVEHWDR